MSIDRTICPNCHKPWADTAPPFVVPGGFHPCELLHGANGTASVYADILFAFADGKIEEWSNKGKYSQISGDGPSWESVVGELEPQEQPEGAPLTDKQKKRLEEIDREITS